MTPGKKIPYKAIRARFEEALENARIAQKLMRENGLPGHSKNVMPVIRQIKVFTDKDGYLDQLEAQGDEPYQHANWEKDA